MRDLGMRDTTQVLNVNWFASHNITAQHLGVTKVRPKLLWNVYRQGVRFEPNTCVAT